MEEFGMLNENASKSTARKPVMADVLVVDDDPRICRVLAHYLGQEGYEVRTALDGEEMRRRIAEGAPDLVVLDLMLPDEDGLTLARELRAHSDVPIIILTGKTGTTEEVAALEVGADDYITKPFDKRNLLAHVHAALRRKSKRGQVSEGREGEPQSDGPEEEQRREGYLVDWYIAPSLRRSC
jgi:DNA-binding response OmpR family regulator